MSHTLSRRSFLSTSSSAAAACLAGGAWPATSLAAGYQSPNEQPVAAFIGCGIRFHSALGAGATKYGPAAAVCDVDLVQAGRAVQRIRDRHRELKRPLVVDIYEDYRRVLDRKDVDVVLIGTPDHWHTKIAIDAMRAGKDVYCEKPLTLTIREGQQLLTAMNETGRVVQVGTQQRTEYEQRFAKAAAMVRDGRIGRPERLTVAIGGSRDCEPLPAVDPPRQLDWDRWLGQAPLTAYRQGPVVDRDGWGAGHPLGRTHRYYRWWYEYSGGKLTDWGAHHVDIALWALDKLRPDVGRIEIDPLEVEHPVPLKDGMPTQDDRFNCATKFNVRVRFEDGVEMMVRHTAADLGFDNGIMFGGTEGRFLVNRGKLVGKPVERLAEDPLPEDALEKLHGGEVPAEHMGNFYDCVKSRGRPASDVESHNRMLAVCHAVNIALRLDRKLVFDPATETFPGDDQANSFLSREQRKGYEI